MLPHEQVRFAHNSERQFAKLLDFYGIVWEYEPRTFTLERDRDGNPVQAFTPDFYLPAYDLYIEITTLNQKLVTKKNRKARRLVEQYPDVSIRVLYQRDYLHLLVKYGLEPPSQLVDADRAGRRRTAVRSRAPAANARRRVASRAVRVVTDALRHSPLDAQHRALGARMVPFGGWDMPLQYTGVLDEHRACRDARCRVRRVASRHGRVRRSRRVLALAVAADERPRARSSPGRAQYTHLLDPDDAHVVDDIIVWWVDRDRFFVMPNASNTDRILAAFTDALDHTDDEVVFADITSTRALLAVQGPGGACAARQGAPRRGRSAAVRGTSDRRNLVAGTGYTGEDGVEISRPGRERGGALGRARATPA